MSVTIDKVKNELHGLQYFVDQIQLNKINVDLKFISNAAHSKEFYEDLKGYRERYIELHDKSPEEEDGKKATGDANVEDSEEESLLSNIEGVIIFYDDLTNQLDAYLDLFHPSQQSDFHYMLDAMQSFVEWTGDYADKIKSFKSGNISEKQIEEFKMSSEFVSVCCNWLSSTVSTVLKYGFDEIDEEVD